MNIIIFDTETTSLDKPFCYNIGYTIRTGTGVVLADRDFVVEQIWHNLPLFSTAYYAKKRPIYIKAMRTHKTIMDKWGYIMQTMIRDIKKFNVTSAYAYNSAFDERVFNFNNDWFKTENPFDDIPIFDIQGYAVNYIGLTKEYRKWSEENQKFSESGNYTKKAEAMFQYITNDLDFVEDHTALSDSQIEADILFYCLAHGAKLEEEYNGNILLKRPKKTPFSIKIDGKEIYHGEYFSKYCRKENYNFKTILKEEE